MANFRPVLIETFTHFHLDSLIYRLRPNPESQTGFAHGAILEWSQDGEQWQDYFFLPPEIIKPLAQALLAAETTDERT
jgi:hypothetical protein